MKEKLDPRTLGGYVLFFFEFPFGVKILEKNIVSCMKLILPDSYISIF